MNLPTVEEMREVCADPTFALWFNQDLNRLISLCVGHNAWPALIAMRERVDEQASELMWFANNGQAKRIAALESELAAAQKCGQQLAADLVHERELFAEQLAAAKQEINTWHTRHEALRVANDACEKEIERLKSEAKRKSTEDGDTNELIAAITAGG